MAAVAVEGLVGCRTSQQAKLQQVVNRKEMGHQCQIDREPRQVVKQQKGRWVGRVILHRQTKRAIVVTVQIGRAVINQKGAWRRIKELLRAFGHQISPRFSLELIVASQTGRFAAKSVSRTNQWPVKLVRQGWTKHPKAMLTAESFQWGN